MRVIWGGMASPPAELIECAKRLEDGLAPLGFGKEHRPFTAHMTIGRVRNDLTGGRLRESVNGLGVASKSQVVNRITVFESRLRPEGAQHIALGRYRLGHSC